MALRPIKLRLDGEEVHLVAERDLSEWGGFLNGGRGASQLLTADNVTAIRRALMVPRHVDVAGVFNELRKQLEDGSALFFEVPPPVVAWDAPPVIDIHELVPTGGDPRTHQPDRPGPDPGIHWIEIVCISADGGSYAGSKARLRFPDGRSEYATLDGGSSVRFDDLTEGGTVHFELSGDAVARGSATVPVATRYELGAPIGLVTRRRHVLVVHPNPNAFISVVLVVDDEPVVGGQYTLSTAAGDQSAELVGEVARAEGFALPSDGNYAFQGVILPPRPGNGRGDNGGGDNGGRRGGGGTDPTQPELTWLSFEVVREDGGPMPGLDFSLTAPDGSIRRATLDGGAMFSADDIPAGESCTLLLRAPGSRAGPSTVALNDDDVLLEADTEGRAALSTGRHHRLVVVEGKTEVALVDSAGKPIEDQLCRVVVDGRVHEGRTDSTGTWVAHHPRNAEVCEVSFPDLDQEAWTLEE